jgi:hypothetical protein
VRQTKRGAFRFAMNFEAATVASIDGRNADAKLFNRT